MIRDIQDDTAITRLKALLYIYVIYMHQYSTYVQVIHYTSLGCY